MITLQPASADEFAAYRAYALNDAGPDRASRQELDRHFPDGPQSKNRHALSIRTTNGAQVGLLWFLVAERPSGPEAFLMDIVIFPPHRRQGHAKEALKHLDHYVDRLRLATISLSVSPENTAAAALYHELGYEPVFTRMTKKRVGRAADMSNDLKTTLIALEKELQRCAVGPSRTRLAELLHPDFVEFGRSGRTYTFAELVAATRVGRESAMMHSADFVLRLVGDRAAILTYKSAGAAPNGGWQHHALRMSLWVRETDGWQLLFHQGTPTDKFECPAP